MSKLRVFEKYIEKCRVDPREKTVEVIGRGHGSYWSSSLTPFPPPPPLPAPWAAAIAGCFRV